MARSPALDPDSPAFVALAGALMVQAAIAIDSLVPALPAVATQLGLGPGSVQLTISLYMAGYAIGQPGWGWASDWLGRRPIILTGTGGYVLATAGCALAQSGEALIAWRFLQGVFAAASMASVRAMMRDHFTGVTLARKMAALNVVYMLSPILAPQLGAALFVMAGWRATLLVPGVVALAAFAMAWPLLTESHAPAARQRRSVGAAARIVADMFRHPLSGPCLGLQGAMSMGLLVWIASSPMIVTGHFGASVKTYGLLFALMAAVMLCGSMACNQLLRRFGPQVVMVLGAVFIGAGGAASFAAADLWPQPLPVLIAAVSLFFIGFGLVVPASGGMALHAFGAMGGFAAAVVGATQGLVGSLGAIAFSRLFDGTPYALGLGLACSAILSVAFSSWLAWRLAHRPELLAHPERLVMTEEIA